MQKKLLGVDLGGTSTKFAIINQEGKIETQWSIPTDISDEGMHIVPNIISSIQKHLSELGLQSSDFLGIGMGSPGTVNRSEGTVIGAYNLNWKTLQAVKQPIEEALGIPLLIENDANVAALGEQWCGAGNKEPNIVFITLGTGVGGGIILNNELILGAEGGAGEIGHITIDGDGYKCTCGKIGCLETIASATGIVRIARDRANSFSDQPALVESILSLDSDSDLTAKDIFDAAKKGDAFAEQVVQQYTHYLGYALANVGSLLNPSTIILGGGVSHAGSYLADKVSYYVRQFIFPTLRDTIKIKIAELGNDAGVIGAASLVLAKMDN